MAGLMRAPVDLRAHPRQHRPGRGRPHAPAGRAPRDPARDAGLDGRPAGRRQRDGGGLEDGAAPRRRSGRPGAHAPEAADHRPLALRAGRRRRVRRLRAGRLVVAGRRRRRAALGARARPAPRRRPPNRRRSSSSPAAARCSTSLGAWERLVAEGVRARVVNLASWEVFARQEQAYRDDVLPPAVTAGWPWKPRRPSAGSAGSACDGDMIGLDRFGASAPAEQLFERFGFTAENVYERARRCWRGAALRRPVATASTEAAGRPAPRDGRGRRSSVERGQRRRERPLERVHKRAQTRLSAAACRARPIEGVMRYVRQPSG